MEIKDKIEPGSTRNRMIRENRFIELKSDYHKKVRDLINYLLDSNPEIKANYSREYIRSKISDFLFNLKFDSELDRDKKIDELFESPSELFKQINSFVIPRIVENLSVDSDIAIGKVSFINYSNENFEKIFRNYGYKEPFENTIVPPEYENDSKASIAIAEVKAGDNERAIEKSEYLIEESLNVLRLYNADSKFGILGDIFFPTVYTMIYNIDCNGLGTSWSLRDKRMECIIDSKKFENFKKIGLDNIDYILKKESSDRTDMENKLILAIRWFGEISKNYEVPENLSKLFIALETLLLKNEEKKLNLAARIPFINYPEMDKGKWIKVSELIVKMYEERSNLVHEGYSNYTETQYYQLYQETQKCILNVAKNIHILPTFSDWKLNEKCTERRNLIKEHVN